MAGKWKPLVRMLNAEQMPCPYRAEGGHRLTNTASGVRCVHCTQTWAAIDAGQRS